MKKLFFIVTVSAAGFILAMNTGVKAQNITYTPLYYISEKVDNSPLVTCPGTGKNPNHVIDPSINYNEVKKKIYPGGMELWNGHLKNWPRKKTNKREM
jgi:hypothetical protein